MHSPRFVSNVHAMPKSSTQRLAELLLGSPLVDFIADRRAAGRSWRLLSRDLREATDGQVDITGETLRVWSAEHRTDAEPAA